MELYFYDGEVFEKMTHAGEQITEREFQKCTFKNCDFSKTDFATTSFHECVFEGCNLSMMKVRATTLNNVVFKDCKILGVNFNECQEFLFSVGFESCVLNYAIFDTRKMPKTKFIASSLIDASFFQVNLAGSSFKGSDLTGSQFNSCDLTDANFVSAYNYAIDPEVNTMKHASFSIDSLSGLLEKYNIKVV